MLLRSGVAKSILDNPYTKLQIPKTKARFRKVKLAVMKIVVLEMKSALLEKLYLSSFVINRASMLSVNFPPEVATNFVEFWCLDQGEVSRSWERNL